MTDFEEYIRQGEPDKQTKAYAWQTAIGLQAVDGLMTSDYLKDTARKHIEGEISIDEARNLIKAYYQSKENREPDDDGKQEADKVSANIAKILSEQSFSFNVAGFLAIHRHIFDGVFKQPANCANMILPRKNGYCVEIRSYMDVGRISAWLWSMTWSKKSSLIIEVWT